MNNLAFFEGKKVFLTGHTGFKGSWLSRILLLGGAEVTGYALEAPAEAKLFDTLHLEENMHSVIGDIRDREKLILGNTRTTPAFSPACCIKIFCGRTAAASDPPLPCPPFHRSPLPVGRGDFSSLSPGNKARLFAFDKEPGRCLKRTRSIDWILENNDLTRSTRWTLLKPSCSAWQLP